MILVASLLLAASLAPAPLAAPADCRTTDLMPAFWDFWDRSREAPASEQYALFESMVMKPNAAVYDGMFRSSSKPPREFVPKALAQVPGLESRMRAMSARLPAELPGQLEAFRKAFPRFRCTVPVYFVYSAGAFDGATREVAGQSALLFGLDVIARLDERLPPLFDHELFHVYHAQTVADSDDFGWALWSEGLATYVSRRLNPDVPLSQICCLPAAADVEPRLAELAADALGLLDSTRREDYARFFLGGQASDVPARSGYTLGYLVASEAGKTRTLEQLAALSHEEVRQLETRELRRIAAAAR